MTHGALPTQAANADRPVVPAPADTVSAIINRLPIGLSVWDMQANLVFANPRFFEVLGLTADAAARISLRDFANAACSMGAMLGRDPDDLLANLAQLAERGRACAWTDKGSDGRSIAFEFHPHQDGLWLLICEDITHQQRASEQLQFLRQNDPLTHLMNREAVMHRLGSWLARGQKVAVLSINFDRFKDINDTWGNPAGNTLLRQSGLRLSTAFRHGDVVGRLGGDRFVIAVPQCSGRHQALACGETVINLLRQPFRIDGSSIRITASVGVALGPMDGAEASALLTHAELALEAAKAAGPGTAVLFNAQMADRRNARRQLEADLRHALERGELIVYYQPIVHAGTGRVASFEALLRWQHPVRGMISPTEFIPVAEATGMILPIGTWVLQRACADAATWPANVGVAINLSGAQFRAGDLCADVHAALSAAGLDPKRLELEITESLLITDFAAARSALTSLRQSGIRIAVDDFGTGYSSLSYLRDFTFDKIKIDKSFVDDLGRNRTSDAVIRAVTRLAADLDVDTVAEGVESDHQRLQLCAHGCTHLQGYFFSRPKPVAAVMGLINELGARAGAELALSTA